MWAKHKQQTGFTIVELLIVIVVIGILAAITIVAFNGVQDRARASSASSAATQAAKKIKVHQVNNGANPTDLAQVGIANSSSTTYNYTTVGSGQDYCVSAQVGSHIYSSQNTDAPIAGGCAQIQVSYFNNVDLSGAPAYQTTEDVINFNWGGNSPKAGIVSADNFSSRWTSYITPPQSGTYTFYTLVDDRVRLYIDGALVIDKWAEAWGEKTAAVTLTAGKPVSMTMETLENSGGAQAWLSWSYGSQAKIVIPQTAYSRSN